MKKEDFLEAIGDIDRDIIEESQRVRQRTKRRVHPAAIILPVAAAGIILALSAAAVIGNVRSGRNTAGNSEEETVDTSAFAESSVHGETTVILTLEGTAEEKMERQSSESDVSILHDEANAAAEKAAEAADAVWREHTAIEYLSSLTGMDEIPEEAVLYADAQWRIVRAENDKEQILVMIRYNEDAGHWEKVCNLHSEKHTMSDKAMAITEASGEFYAYYLNQSEQGTLNKVKTERMTAFIFEHGIHNYMSLTAESQSAEASDPEEGLRFTEAELENLRGQCTVSYDQELSEKLVPQFLAYHIATNSGYLKLKDPVCIFRVDVEDSYDPDTAQLIVSYFGASKKEYFLLSSFSQFDKEEWFNVYRFNEFGLEDPFAGSISEWQEGKLP